MCRKKRRIPSRSVGERKEPHRMGLAAQKGVREVCFLTIEMVMSCGRAAAGGKARFQHKFLGYPSDE